MIQIGKFWNKPITTLLCVLPPPQFRILLNGFVMYTTTTHSICFLAQLALAVRSKHKEILNPPTLTMPPLVWTVSNRPYQLSTASPRPEHIEQTIPPVHLSRLASQPDSTCLPTKPPTTNSSPSTASSTPIAYSASLQAPLFSYMSTSAATWTGGTQLSSTHSRPNVPSS